MPDRPSRSVVVAGALDVVCILVFVAIGRSSHHDGVTVGGMVSTAWPFLVGAACGWGAIRAWRHPLQTFPVGVAIWVACVGVGMVLRVIAGQGTAVAFVIVALAFLGLALLGWRTVARMAGERGPLAGFGRTRSTNAVE